MPSESGAMAPHEFENRIADIRQAQEQILLAVRSIHWGGASTESIGALRSARKSQYAALVAAIGFHVLKSSTSRTGKPQK